jgi:hypothetical protein
MKPMKKYLIFLIISLLIITIVKIVKACGPFPTSPNEYKISFFNSKIGDNKEIFEPYYYNANDEYSNSKFEIGNKQENIDNYREWRNALQINFTYNDFEEAIKIYYENIDYTKIAKNKSQKNTFFIALEKKQAFENYFAIAKESEAFNSLNAFDDKWGLDENSKIEPIPLLTKIYSLINTTKENFIRYRCAYLLCRLYYYQNNVEKLEHTYVKFFKNNKSKSWINIAAKYFYTNKCIKNKNKHIENLLDVVENSNSKRYRAIDLIRETNYDNISFSTKNKIAESNYLVSQCIYKNGYSLKNIKTLQSLNPKNKFLKTLITREINKLEHWVFSNNCTDYYLDKNEEYVSQWDFTSKKIAELKKQNSIKDIDYANQLKQFIINILPNKKKDKIVFYSYLCHLNFITKNYSEAIQNSNYIIKNADENSKEIIHAKTNKLLANIELNKGLTSSTQSQILDLFKNNKAVQITNEFDTIYFRNSIINYLAKSLYRNKDFVHATLMYNIARKSWGEFSSYLDKTPYLFLYEHAKPNDYDSLIKFLEKTNKTKFEKYCIENYNPDSYNRNIFENKNIFYDLKGTYYVLHDKLEMALQSFKKVDKNYWKNEQTASYAYLNDNPFELSVYSSPGTYELEQNIDKPYCNKAIFIQKLIDLKNNELEAKDFEEKAKFNFQIGNAYYSLTHKGKFWIVSKPWWGQSEYESEECNDLKDFENVYYNCFRAKKYYTKAFNLTKNKKTAAFYAMYINLCNRNYANENDIPKKSFYALLKRKTGTEVYYENFQSNCDDYQNYLSEFFY